METILNTILAFLLGAVITAFGYTLTLSSGLAKLSMSVNNAVNKLEGVCTSITTLTDKVDRLSERTARLEAVHPENNGKS